MSVGGVRCWVGSAGAACWLLCLGWAATARGAGLADEVPRCQFLPPSHHDPQTLYAHTHGRAAGLNSEQLALLDFLVLARAHTFVGFGPSTFSTYLREHRMLHGVPPDRSALVNASRIGTDAMFSRSALVASRRIAHLGVAAA